jgi:hypothetical protein
MDLSASYLRYSADLIIFFCVSQKPTYAVRLIWIGSGPYVTTGYSVVPVSSLVCLQIYRVLT